MLYEIWEVSPDVRLVAEYSNRGHAVAKIRGLVNRQWRSASANELLTRAHDPVEYRLITRRPRVVR